MRPAAVPLVPGTMPLYHALWSSLMAISLGLQELEARAGVPELLAGAGGVLVPAAADSGADWLRAYA